MHGHDLIWIYTNETILTTEGLATIHISNLIPKCVSGMDHHWFR